MSSGYKVVRYIVIIMYSALHAHNTSYWSATVSRFHLFYTNFWFPSPKAEHQCPLLFIRWYIILHLERTQLPQYNNSESGNTTFYLSKCPLWENIVCPGSPHWRLQETMRAARNMQPLPTLSSILIAYLGNNSLPVSLQLWPAEWRSGAVAQTQRGLPETKARDRFSC